MWEAIQQNKRRSWMLLGVMGLLLLTLGYAIGGAIFYSPPSLVGVARGLTSLQEPNTDPDGVMEKLKVPDRFSWMKDPALLLNRGGMYGALLAAIVWGLMTSCALFAGDAILLRSATAHEISKQDAPRLWNTVEEMTIAAGLPAMPRVYIIDDDRPNAFAVGRNPKRAAVAVSAGMLKRLTRDELQGVVAHEIGHIHNQDVRFMTLASIMVGSIVLISDVFLRSLWYGAGRRRSSSSKGGQAQVILLVFAIVLAIIAPIAARLLFFACSRRREYLADACSARFTRFPDGLASALEKIGAAALLGDTKHVSKSLAPLYIVNPLQSASATGLFSTHPPLEKRITILRAMAGGAGYVDYEAAYRKVLDEQQGCLDEAFLSKETHVGARKANPEPKPKEDAVERAREALDVINRAAGLLMIPCACGMRIKIPPELTLDAIKCPRCGRSHDVPKAAPAADAPRGKAPGPPTYHRNGTGWESFRCACGQAIQLSPTFSAKHISCRKCGRHVKVIPSQHAK